MELTIGLIVGGSVALVGLFFAAIVYGRSIPNYELKRLRQDRAAAYEALTALRARVRNRAVGAATDFEKAGHLASASDLDGVLRLFATDNETPAATSKQGVSAQPETGGEDSSNA